MKDAESNKVICPFSQDSVTDSTAGNLTHNLSLNIRKGLSYTKLSVISSTDVREFDILNKSFCQMGYVSKGSINLQIPELGKKQLKAGDWFVSSIGEIPTRFTVKNSAEILIVECDKSTFNDFGLTQTAKKNSRLECLLCEMRAEPFFISSKAHGRLGILSKDLSELNVQRISDRLRSEARILDFVATLIEEPELSDGSDCGYHCKDSDREALENAAKLLQSSLNEDHSISSISRSVHLNEFKLKQGFKQLHGNTVFGYLREKRMDKAEDLLRNTEMPVIEVANHVGYSNPGHFSRAFKERFGLLPKSYQTKYRSI